MEKFNIQVLVEDEDIEFPNSVMMNFSLAKQDISVDRSISMLLNEEESAYYFEDPFELIRRAVKPRLSRRGHKALTA